MDAPSPSTLLFYGYLLAFSTAALACLAGARRALGIEDKDVRRGLLGLLLASAVWASFHVGLLLTPTGWSGRFFYQGGLVVGFATVWAWLWFCSAYSGRSLHRARSLQAVAVGTFGVVTLVKLTNPLHGLYYSVEVASAPFAYLQVNHHALYWATTGLAYMLAGIGLFMLFELLARVRGARWPLAGLFGLTAFPVLLNGAGYVSPWLLEFSHEPLGVAAFATGALYFQQAQFAGAFGTGRPGPTLIVGGDDRLLAYNDRAVDLFPALAGPEAVGRPIGDLRPDLAKTIPEEGAGEPTDLLEAAPAGDTDDRPAPDQDENIGKQPPRYVRPIVNQTGIGPGRTVTFIDVTAQELRRRDRESRLEVLFEKSPAMIDVHDGAGNLIEANARFFEKTHYREDDLPGLKVWDIDSSLDRKEAIGLWDGMEPGDQRQIEGQYRRKDGSTFPVEVHMRHLRLGGKDRFVVIGRDITERKQARQELKTERDRLETLLDNLPTPVVRCRVGDGEARITGTNPAFEKTFGVDRKEAEGEDLNVLLVPEERRGEAAEIDRRALGKGTEVREVRRLAADGDRDFRLQVAGREPEEGPPEIYAIYTDITDQKRRERQLRAAKGRYQTLVDNFPDGGVFLFDEDLTYTLAGGKKIDILGRAEDIVGSPVGTLLPEPLAQEQIPQYRRALEGERGDFEQEYKGRHYRVRTLPVRDEEREVIAGMSVSQDVTEQKRRERRLQQAETLFQNAQEALFLIDVSPQGPDGQREFSVRRINPAYEEKTGFSEENLRGRSPTEVIDGEAGRQMERRYRECVRQREPLAYEEQVPLKGKMTYWTTRIAPVVVEGTVQQIVGTSRDITEQRRRKEELERKNDLFEKAQEIADVGAWEYDVNADELRWTNQVYRIYARGDAGGPPPSLESAIGSYHPADCSAIREAFTDAVTKGEPYDLELRLRDESGEERWVRTRGQPQRDGEEVIQVRGTIRDITARKRREKTLRAQRKKVEALYETTKALLSTERPEEVLRRLHEVIDSVFDYDLSNTGFIDGDMIEPVDASISGPGNVPSPEPRPVGGESLVARALRAGETVVVQDTSALNNEIDYGSLRALAAVPIGRAGVIILGRTEATQFRPFDLQLVEVLASYGSAVINQLRQEKRLREERDLLGRLLEISPDAVVRLGPDGTFLQASGRAEEVLGIGEAEIMGRTYNDLAWEIAAPGGGDLPDERLPFARILRTGEPVENVQFSIGWPDGTRRLLSVSGAPLRDEMPENSGLAEDSDAENVENGGAVFYISDITEQKRQERDLREAKEEAEKANRMQSAFLANMSHEIRTPLTSIIGFAEALGAESSEMELPSGSALPKYAELIEQGGKRLLQTLEGVLNLSKLEAGQMTLSAEPVDLAAQAHQTVEELRPDANKKQIHIQVETEDGLAKADEGGVQIIARNLLSNAIKYTEKGGTIWVRTHREEGQVVLEVEDTGIGMEPSVADRLFEPFRQASEGWGRKYEGTGVGLAVTRRATQEMKGSVEVETEKGEGSRFTVRLPMAE